VTALRKLHQREVPVSWEKRLAEISPRTNRFTWLKLVWEPGFPWEEPVERYMLMQMTPAHAVDQYVLEQLEHPLPPSEMGNYWDPHMKWVDDADGSERIGLFVRNPDCLITEQAYWLYRETGAWAKRYWVIQGDKGGHKYRFTQVEQRLLRFMNLPTDPPVPGTLPYAPFDERVIAQMELLDMLKGLHGGLKRQRALLAGAMGTRRDADERKLREMVMVHLKEQAEQVGDDVHKALLKLDAPRRQRGSEQRDLEAASEIAEENFLETGRTNGGKKIHLLS
jgi:hypothetical protein